MNTGHKSYINEVQELTSQIITDKCNSKKPEYEIVVCNMNNWIIDRFDSHLGHNYIKNILLTNGYVKSKKSNADHYALITKIGEDVQVGSMWLRRV